MISRKLFRTLVVGVVCMVASAAAAQDRSAATTLKDAWITTQVEAKYFGDSVVKGRNIDVDTTTGVVTLTGEVGSLAERRRAVALAKEVDGVSRVVDRLTLVPEKRGTSAERMADKADDKADRAKDKMDDKADRAKDKADAKADKVANRSQDRADRTGNDISDAWITTKLKSKYYVDDDVKGLNIDVTTNGGVVTLTGKVSNAAQRAKALSLAKTTDGVKQVVDKLTIGR